MDTRYKIKYVWSAETIGIFMVTCPRCGGLLQRWGDELVCTACMYEEIERIERAEEDQAG